MRPGADAFNAGVGGPYVQGRGRAGCTFGRGFPRDFIAVGSHVDEGGDDDGNLPNVRFLDALVDVHVGMVGARVVIQWILDELKAGRPTALKAR
jgi:hypothetical protein